MNCDTTFTHFFDSSKSVSIPQSLLDQFNKIGMPRPVSQEELKEAMDHYNRICGISDFSMQFTFEDRINREGGGYQLMVVRMPLCAYNYTGSGYYYLRKGPTPVSQTIIVGVPKKEVTNNATCQKGSNNNSD